jgi:nitrite reductase/ring-hydroxylating ferredoxin subunit
MTETYIAHAAEIPEGDRRIVTHGGREIGIFRWQGNYYAYDNTCLHQGGPACEGLIMHKVEDVVTADRRVLGHRFSQDEVHFVCPWHGYEYDLKTGECAGDRRLRLRSYKVIERAGEIYLVTA